MLNKVMIMMMALAFISCSSASKKKCDADKKCCKSGKCELKKDHKKKSDKKCDADMKCCKSGKCDLMKKADHKHGDHKHHDHKKHGHDHNTHHKADAMMGKKAAVGSTSEAASTSAVSAASMTCSLGEDTRTLEIKEMGSGCELLYTKNGETNSIANASYNASYCGEVQTRVADKLTASGFSCN